MLFCLSHLAPAPVCVHHAPFQAKTYPTTGAKTCVYVCTVIPIYIYRQPGRGRDAIHGSVDAKKHQEISRGPWRVSILRRFKPCIQHSPTPIGLYHARHDEIHSQATGPKSLALTGRSSSRRYKIAIDYSHCSSAVACRAAERWK